MNAYSIISSASHALTGTAYTFPADSTRTRLIRVWGDVAFHVSTSGDATTDDLPVAGGLQGVLLNAPPGGLISVIKKSGEPDGISWFSHVKRN